MSNKKNKNDAKIDVSSLKRDLFEMKVKLTAHLDEQAKLECIKKARKIKKTLAYYFLTSNKNKRDV